MLVKNIKSDKKQFVINSSRALLFLGAGSAAPLGLQTFVGFRTLLTGDVKLFLDKVALSMELVGQRVDIEGLLWKLQNYLEVEKSVLSDSLFSNHVYGNTIQVSRLKSFFEKVRLAKAGIDRIKVSHYGHFEAKQRNAVKEKLDNLYNFYKKVADFNDGNLHIVTSNYDVVFEEMWIRKRPTQINLITGIEGDFVVTGYGSWNPAIYDIVPNQGRFAWYIYRLHGCTHWFFGQKSIYYSSKGPSDSSDKPCIMDPGSKFNISDEPFRTMFNKFEMLLKQCRICLFIGFSFHDNDILELLLHVSAMTSRPLHILILNRNPDINRGFLHNRLKEMANFRPMNYDCRRIHIDCIEGSVDDEDTQNQVLDGISSIVQSKSI